MKKGPWLLAGRASSGGFVKKFPHPLYGGKTALAESNELILGFLWNHCQKKYQGQKAVALFPFPLPFFHHLPFPLSGSRFRPFAYERPHSFAPAGFGGGKKAGFGPRG